VGVAPTRVDFGGNNFITTAVASNSGRTLKIGGSNHTGGITVIGAYNPLSARLELVTGGQMTINAAGTVTSPNIALAGSNFSNAAGAAALVASGRWLVYSADPALNTFGGLNSGNLAQWGRTYVANPPSTISATGNRYVFSKVPQMTATLAIGTVNKIYGTDLTGSTPAVNISGLVDAATYGNVFLQDSSGGTATTSSAGYAPTAAVNNSVPYAVSISGITAPDGYGPIITNDGEVIVAPYVVNLNGTRTYDGTVNMPAANLGTNALIGTQTLTLTGTGTVANRNVGAGKALTPGSLALGNGSNGGLAANYTLTGGTHAASITQAPVTFGTNNVSKVYDGTLTAAGATVIRSGAMFGGDTFSGGNFAFTNKNVGAGNKSVSTSGVSVNDGNGGGNYSISYELNTSSTISPYVVSLNGSRTYDGTVNMPAANLGTNALVGTETLTLTGTGTVASRNVGAGKALTPGSLALGNGSNGGLASNYTLTGGTHAASITQAPVTFGTNDVSKVYDGTLTAAGAAVIRSGAMFGGDTFSGGNFAFTDKNVGAGNKTVTTGGVSVNDGNGGGNYSVSYALNTSSTISPYVVSLTGSRRYDGTANFLAADLTMSTLVGAETLTLAGTGTVANADIATGKALTLGTLALGNGSNGGLASNYTLTGGTHLASIVGALLGITANDATRTYNGLAWNGGNGVTYSGFLPGDSEADLSGTLVFSGTSQGAVNVGNYSIIPSGLSSDTYTIEFISGNLSITPATLGIAANSAVNVYSGLGWSGGNGATYTGFQDNDTAADLVGTLSYSGTSQGAVNVGTYSILASGQSSPNYTITYTNGNLVIAPAALSIIADSTSKTYGDTVSFIGTEFRSSGLKNGETIGRVSLASSGAHPLASVHGSPYEIIPHNARDGSFKPTNYTITYFNGKLTVLPAGLLGVTANSVVNVYNGVPWSGGSGVTYTGFQGDDTVADLDGTLVYGGSSQGAVDVGTYSIVPSGLSSTNYTISYIDGSLIITPATLGIVANNRSKNFGSTVTFTGNEFSSSGLQNNETIGSVTLTSAGAAANASVADSPYTIVPGNALGGSFNPANYTISYIDGSLEVIPVGLLGIAANSVVKVYNGLTWTGGNGVTYSGFKGNDTAASLTGTLSYGGTSQGAVDVGNYSIVPFGQSSPNYTITYTSGNLAITPAPLDIAALDISKNYGTALDFTGDEFSSSGLQNGETIGTVTLTSTGTVASASVANGPYTIVATNATGGSFNPANYTIGYTNGNLSVSPVPLMVTADPRTKLIGTPDPALTFSVTGLVNNAQLGVVDTAASVLSGALMRAPGETVAGNPYPINRGSLVANSNYTLDFTPANLLITAADVVVPGPGPGIAPAPIIFSGLIHNVFYHRPGNFWHISLNASGADFGFDVLRGTGTEETRLRKSLNRCDSVSGRGFCETWAFPQQQDNGQ
jgi:flagella basal body P-ring formation protein FlgA